MNWNEKQNELAEQIREQLTDSFACSDVVIRIPEEELAAVCDAVNPVLGLDDNVLEVSLGDVEENSELLALLVDAPRTAELLAVVVEIGRNGIENV